MMERPVFNRNRNETTDRSHVLFLPRSLAVIRLAHFHELFVCAPPPPNDLTPPSPLRVRRASTRYALGPKKRAVCGVGFGRWALAHHGSSRSLPEDPDGSQWVRAWCAFTVCICVYCDSLVFAARGRLAEIDPIPQL